MATHFNLYLLLSLVALQSIAAVQFIALNDAGESPGGVRFTNEIGIDYTVETMESTTNFIWNMFEQTEEQDRQPVDQVTVDIVIADGMEGGTQGPNINISALYLNGYQGDLKWEFTSLLYHEMTHVWQWTGQGKAPRLLIEGVADYTILKANYYPPGFAKPGMGDRWDQGYDFTARFLEYCEGIRPGFVAALNKMMKDDYSDNYFNQLLGKSVNDLWNEYKVKYSGSVMSGQKAKFKRLNDYRNRKMG